MPPTFLALLVERLQDSHAVLRLLLGVGRRIRFIPEGGSLVEVTCRVIQGRFLLRPSEELNQIVVGILARAARLYAVEIVGAVFLANHFHLLVRVDDARALASFMGYLNGNLAREAGRLHGWREKFWARRYQAILVSGEEAAQVARLKYLLSHGAKEGLVARPLDWPGVHCAQSLLTGEPLAGLWFDRTREYEALRRREPFERTTYAESESLLFSKLPCWAHLSGDAYRRRIADLLDDIEQEAARMRARAKIVLPCRRACVRKLRRQDPHAKPTPLATRPAPLIHAARREVREELQRAYTWFVSSYRQAARRLRAGEHTVRFPEGSFPPALPFVLPVLARPP